MYEDLVKHLRNRANGSYEEKCEGCEFTEDFPPCVHCTIKAFNDAANVIEKLSSMECDFRQYISDQVKREKGVYACFCCKNRESANKYEPGCSHEECDGVSGWEYGTPKEET